MLGSDGERLTEGRVRMLWETAKVIHVDIHGRGKVQRCQMKDFFVVIFNRRKS